MKIKEIVDALERFAPLPLQDGFDNAGLQVGLTDADCAGALLCLDVTEEVIDEAIGKGCNLIVSHHPLIFKGLKAIVGNSYVERCLMKAIKHDIVIFSAHTNLDNVSGGVNFKMAEKIGLRTLQILEPKTGVSPEAGAGVIGELQEPEEDLCFMKRIKSLFAAGCVKHTAFTGRKIRKVAICGGSGAFLIPSAIEHQADIFITGEIKYHDYFGHGKDILLAEIGHYESEQYTKEIFYQIISEAFADVRTYMTEINTNPINYL